jgi:hypothetical protein
MTGLGMLMAAGSVIFTVLGLLGVIHSLYKMVKDRKFVGYSAYLIVSFVPIVAFGPLIIAAVGIYENPHAGFYLATQGLALMLMIAFVVMMFKGVGDNI